VVYLVTTSLYSIEECAVEKKLKKIGEYLAMMWTKIFGLLFGPPCIIWSALSKNAAINQSINHIFNVA